MTPEVVEHFHLYDLACAYLTPDEWYEVFIAHDYTTRPQAMIDAARRKRAETLRQPDNLKG